MTSLPFSDETLALNADVLGLAKSGKIKGAPRIAAADLAADPYKSKLERQFAQEQADKLFLPGWGYEKITLRIAGGAYTPDFFGDLRRLGGGLGAVEVKGWGQSLDRSKAKFRAAVQEHRWLIFGWVVWNKRDGWQVQWYERGPQ